MTRQPIRTQRGAGYALWGLLLLLATAGAGAAEQAAHVPVEEFELDNGMKFLLVQRPDQTTVNAAWVAKVGSANERPGITGISHFFEHMMFKGTHTIGTTDSKRDLEIIREQEAIQEQIRAIYRQQRERWRLGEISDPFSDEQRPPELVALQERFQQLVQEEKKLMVKEEYDKIYTEAGATNSNATTNEDMTVYFISVPANKLELWFWMESDRLSNPVFREFYPERDVVYEERRLRTESTPTGRFDEQFDAMFWQSHPYGWPVVGWPSDLEVYTLAQAEDYFNTYYAPNNITMVLVGNFDPEEVKQQAKRYFGRIPRGKVPPPDVVTLEIPQQAEMRMSAECDCQPQVEVRYHAVPFRHKDGYALQVLAGLLNGRTGRLYKSMVVDQGIASDVFAGPRAMKWAGYFFFSAEAKGDATPEQLEQAWYAELRRIQEEPIPAEELQKVKNGIAANAYRRLENPFFLMFQLAFYEGFGDWEYLNYGTEKTLAVTAEDVQRVARAYFAPENRAVATYYRKEGSQPEDPEIAALPEQLRQMAKVQLQQIRQVNDPEQLETGLNQLNAQKAGAPPQVQPLFPLIEKAIRQRLEELRAAAKGGDE